MFELFDRGITGLTTGPRGTIWTRLEFIGKLFDYSKVDRYRQPVLIATDNMFGRKISMDRPFAVNVANYWQ